jgi:hypothetical protein
MDERYWIALNGSSCGMTSLPMAYPKVTPTPEQLLGFPTLEEAARAQQVCLYAPMDEVQRFLESLRPDVKRGRVRVIQPKHPQPPIASATMWTEDADAHQVVQRAFIKTTSQ